MQRKLIVAIDIDDVIVEFSPRLVKHYSKTYGTNLRFADVYSDDISSRWNAPDWATAIGKIEEYLATEEFQSMPPLHESLAVMRRLAKRHILYIVTGRSLTIEVPTMEILIGYFPGIFRSVTFTDMNGHKKRAKADICLVLGADILVEVHLGHAIPVAKSGITVLLFGEYPWNKTDTLSGNIKQVKNWAVIEELIDAESRRII